MHDKNIAAVLALVGGTIGMHKFYLKDPGSGIFYTVLSIMTSGFLFPVGAMLGVIDAIRLFTMSTASFDAKYNKNKSTTRRRQSRSRSAQRAPQSRTRRDASQNRERYAYEKTKKSKRSNPFRKSADQKYEEYDLEGALEDYTKSAEISEPDKKMYFKLACIHSLLENTDAALENLEKAFDLGFKNVEKLKTTDRLAYLRIQPEYDAFVSNGYKVAPKAQAVEPPEGDLLQDDLLLSQLNKLKELRNRGLLSEKEYAYEKQKLRKQ